MREHPERSLAGSLGARGAFAQLAGIVAIASACLFAAPATAEPTESVRQSPPLAGAALLAALRHGGYVICFRHASTDFGQSDDRMAGYEDCARQRSEAAAIEPRGSEGFRVVAQIRKEEWPALSTAN